MQLCRKNHHRHANERLEHAHGVERCTAAATAELTNEIHGIEPLCLVTADHSACKRVSCATEIRRRTAAIANTRVKQGPAPQHRAQWLSHIPKVAAPFAVTATASTALALLNMHRVADRNAAGFHRGAVNAQTAIPIGDDAA